MKKLLLVISVLFCLNASATNVTISSGTSFSYTAMGSLTTGNQDTLFVTAGSNFTGLCTIKNIYGTAAHHITIIPTTTSIAYHPVTFSGGLRIANFAYVDIRYFRFTTSAYGILMDGDGANGGTAANITWTAVTNCDGINLTSAFIKNYNSIQCNWSKTDSTKYDSWHLTVDSLTLTNCGSILVGAFGTVAGAKDVTAYDTIRNVILNDPQANEQITYIAVGAYVGHILRHQVTVLHYTGDVGLVNAGGTGRGFSGTVEYIESEGPWSGWIARLNVYKFWKNRADSTVVRYNFKQGSTSFGLIYADANSSDLKTDTIEVGTVNVQGNGMVNAPSENQFYNDILFLGANTDTVTMKNNWSANASREHGTGSVPDGTFTCNSCSPSYFDTAKNYYYKSATLAKVDSTTNAPFAQFKPLFGSPLIAAGVSTTLTGVGKKDLAGVVSVNNNIGPWEYVPTTVFTYSVTSAPVLSAAGVYNSSGTLIRTIFTMKVDSVNGTKTAWWDGYDDFHNVATGGPFTIKAVSSQLSATWDGVIGNSGDVYTGVHALASLFTDQNSGSCVTYSGSKAYWAGGYGEGSGPAFSTPISDINYSNGFITAVPGGLDIELNATDGTNVYWAGFDAFDTTKTFVMATTVSGDAAYSFPSGTFYSPHNGFSTCAYNGSGANYLYRITGVGVQKTHNYLVVTRRGAAQVYIVNKTSGATAHTYASTSPGSVAIDGNDNVWISTATGIIQYSLDGSGNMTATGLSISLTAVGSIAVSPNGTKLIVADLSSGQIKEYYTATGTATGRTWGTGVSYKTSAAVANNKPYWSDSTGTQRTFIAYLPDSSVLVGDRVNTRTLHIGSNLSTFIDAQYYTPTSYYVWADPNNPLHVYCGFLEYLIDTTKSIQSCWTLVNNWAGKNPNAYNTLANIGNPITISGHTYGTLTNSGVAVVVELMSGGAMRFTGITLPSMWAPRSINPDGTFVAITSGSGGTSLYKRYAYTGLDGSNNPTWSGTASSTTTIPAAGNNNVYNANSSFNSTVNETTNGNLVWYGPSKVFSTYGQGYHLGSIHIGASAYRHQTYIADSSTYTGPYFGHGQSMAGMFDNGNNVNNAGGVFSVYGLLILTGYHGEFWKNVQTNYYNFWDDSTMLMLYQFGASGYDYFRQPAPAGVAGNALGGVLVPGPNGVLYLYHGDETQHNGVHRWTITGWNNIIRQVCTSTPTPLGPTITGVDLLAGLSVKRGQPLANGDGGWIRTPVIDVNNSSIVMSSMIGRKSFDFTKSPDLYFTDVINSSATTVQFSKQQLAAGARTTSWKDSVEILWEDNIDNPYSAPPYNHGNFFEITDSSNKIISEIHISSSGNLQYVVVNGNSIHSDTINRSILQAKQQFVPLIFTYTSGTLNVSYNGWSTNITTPFDAGADMTQPYNIRMRANVILDQGGASRVGKKMTLQNAYFIQTYIPPMPPPPTGCNSCLFYFQNSKKIP